MARPGTLMKEDLRTPQEEVQIIRKAKKTTTIRRYIQIDYKWIWDPLTEKVSTERILDDGAARWRNYSRRPKLATWHSLSSGPQALLKIQRSYRYITKAQVYYGRDENGKEKWSGLQELSSRDIVLDGGAGWGFYPPAWETQQETAPITEHADTDADPVATNTGEVAATDEAAPTIAHAPAPAEPDRTDNESTSAAAPSTGDDAEAGPVAGPAPTPEQTPAVAPVRAMPGQKVAYVRVASKDQNLARQREALEPVGIDRWFSDQISARSKAGRPGLDDCLAYVRDGNELHVASIDRLARSLIDLKQLIAQLTSKGVSVHFHKENLAFSANKTDPTATLMLGILGSFAEFERSIIRERQAEGIALAKKAGKYTGRPRALSDEQAAEARSRVAAGEKKTAIAEEMGVSRSTLYRHL